MHRVQPAQRLAGALEEVARAGLDRREAAHVQVGRVHGRRPRVDPLRERAADAGAEDDALRVHARGDEEPGDLGGLPEQEVAVRREALRRAQVVGEARLCQRRHADARLGERPREVLQVRLELAEGEVRRDRRRRARPAVRLERADDEAAAVVTHVDGAVEVADDGQVASGALHRLGLRPVVLRGVQREPGAGEQAEVARPQPGGDDGDFALHRPAVGLHGDDAAAVEREPGDARALDHAHAEVVGRLGRREGGPAGVDRRVVLEEHPAGEVADGQQRRDGADLVGRQLARRQAVVMGHRQRVAQLGQALRRARDRERAVGVVTGVHAGERREPRVEVAAVGGELGLHVGAAGPRHEPRGVPAGAARHPAALEDDRVGPAQPGQVDGHGGADDAAADHDRPRSRGRRRGGLRVEARRRQRRVTQPLLQRPSSPSFGISVSGVVLPFVGAGEAAPAS